MLEAVNIYIRLTPPPKRSDKPADRFYKCTCIPSSKDSKRNLWLVVYNITTEFGS